MSRFTWSSWVKLKNWAYYWVIVTIRILQSSEMPTLWGQSSQYTIDLDVNDIIRWSWHLIRWCNEQNLASQLLMIMMLGTFEQMENTWSTLLKRWKNLVSTFEPMEKHLVGTFEPMEKHLVGTFDEYGADGQGEEGWVSDNKAANISHLSQIFIHYVAIVFSSSKSFCEREYIHATYLWQPAMACPLMMCWCHSRYLSY